MSIQTTVRCFRRPREETGLRRGVWLMTGHKRGEFFHGDRCEVQAPAYNVDGLAAEYETITPEEALAEMDKGWPEAKEQMLKIFARHPIQAEAIA